MTAITIIYIANIFLAGWISFSCLFMPKNALLTVFTGAYGYSEIIRLVGAFWAAIAILSIIGLYYPIQMSLILLFQLIYKASWLVVVAIPATIKNRPLPHAMAIFFIIWVLLLPFVIPWNLIFISV